MEPNQLTCPQCGLVNNNLSEACAQCGIIFVKNAAMQAAQNDPAMQARDVQDEQKRKAIEEAEAILEQSDPADGNATLELEMDTGPDPAEDTLEMMIPTEPEAPAIKSEAASADETKSEENQNTEHPEIEMEAFETTIEMVTEPTDIEELFLSEVNADRSEEPTDSETVGKPVDAATDSHAEAEQSDKWAKWNTSEPESKDQKKDDTPVTQPEAELAADTKPQKDQKEQGPEAPEPTKREDAAAEVAEPGNSKEAITDFAKPAEQKIPVWGNPESMAAEKSAGENEAGAPEESAKKQETAAAQEASQKKQQEIQVREALKKQRETQAKAEALRKEKADLAQAAALKKKKLDRVKAEALKKQKAAQAKAEALKKRKEALAKAKSVKKQKTAQAGAEALKKQKEAQAIAEASAQEIQIASSGVQEAGSQTTAENRKTHEKFLGLLKRYKGKAIGINYDNSTEIKEAKLIEANEEFFSVMVKDKKLQYSYPLKSILTIIEGQEGVETGQDDKKLKFDAVIKVFPLVAF
jgi:hypothetical protein